MRRLSFNSNHKEQMALCSPYFSVIYSGSYLAQSEVTDGPSDSSHIFVDLPGVSDPSYMVRY